MPSKQLIAYAVHGGGAQRGARVPAPASGCCAGARCNAAFATENVDAVFTFFFNHPGPRGWRGRAGARLFAVVSGLLFTVSANALQKADPFSKKQCIAIAKLLAETF